MITLLKDIAYNSFATLFSILCGVVAFIAFVKYAEPIGKLIFNW